MQIVAVGEGGDKKESGRKNDPDPAAIPNPADGRYVDNNYEPLTADDLQKFMGNNAEIDLEQAYLAVAKRIPLRMKVSMDQRFVDKLLVECANSELTVEVRQLTIESEDEGNRRRGGRGGLGGLGGGVEDGFGGGGGGANAKDAGSQFPFDLKVEIYGIVSIYNPVDNAALGIESEEDETEEEEEARATAGTIRR